MMTSDDVMPRTQERVIPFTSPEFRTELVGRNDELERLLELVTRGGHSVTIVGPPGVGKSRLAWELGRTLVARGRSTALHAVDVSQFQGDTEVLARLCASLLSGTVATRRDEALQDLVETLSVREHVVLLFDNAERLLGPVLDIVQELQLRSPETRIVVTSREPGRSALNRTLRIEPLSVPDSVRLFTLRSALFSANRVESAERSEDVLELVKRLDGLPLSIELAAARSRMFSPAQMLELLNERLKLLRLPEQGSSQRLSTLQGTLDWSWEMLSAWERSALMQCSVFAGPFSHHDAEHVVVCDEPDAPWMVDILQALYDRSLISIYRSENDSAEPEVMYVMYASVRDYVITRAPVEVTASAWDRLVTWYSERSAWWLSRMDTLGDRPAFAWYDSQRSNLHAVLEFGIRQSPEVAARLLMTLDTIVHEREPYNQLKELYHRIIEALGDGASTIPFRARLLRRLGHHLMLRGALDEGKALVMSAVELQLHDADADEERRMRISVAYLHMREGRFDDSEAELKQALAKVRPSDSPVNVAMVHLYLGMLYGTRAEADAVNRHNWLQQALTWYQASVNLIQNRQTHRFLAVLYSNIGTVYLRLDMRTEQRHYFQRCLEHAAVIDNRLMEAMALANLAWVAILEHDLDRAEALLHESLPLQRTVRRLNAEGMVYQRIGVLEALRERWNDASERLLRARDLFYRSGEDRLAIDSELLLGYCRIGAMRPSEALRYAESARLKSEELGDESRAVLARWVQAAAAALLGDRDLPVLLSELAAGPEPQHHDAPEELISMLHGIIEAGRTDGGQDVDAARARMGELTAGMSLRERLPAFVPQVRLLAMILEQILRVAQTTHEMISSHARVVVTLPESVPAPESQAAPPHRLQAGPSTIWVRLNEGDTIDLERRRVVRRILDELIENRIHQPGRPVPVSRLVEAAWPGQRFVAESGANRVYVAIATLRTLGLGEVLQTRSGGYLIDSHAMVGRTTSDS
jgi:predicted ATPase/tetratricopeptide (TPR) repeat protein